MKVHMSNAAYKEPHEPDDALCGNRRNGCTTTIKAEVTCDPCMWTMARLDCERREAAERGKR